MASTRPRGSPMLPLAGRRCGMPACGGFILQEDTHRFCVACLGLGHALASMSPPSPATGINCVDCLQYDHAGLLARYNVVAGGLALGAGAHVPPAPGPPPPSRPGSAVRQSAAPRHMDRPPASTPPAATGGRGSSRPSSSLTSPESRQPNTGISPTGSNASVPRKKTCKTNRTAGGGPVPGPPPTPVPVVFKEFHPLVVGDIPLSLSVEQLRAMPSPPSWHPSDGDEPPEPAVYLLPADNDEMDEDVSDWTEDEDLPDSSPTLPSGQGDPLAGAAAHARATAPAPRSPHAPHPPPVPARGCGARAPDPDTLQMDELSVFERAAARCALELPLEDPPRGPRGRIPVLGQDVEPSPPQRMAKLPVVPGFAEALHSSWTSHKDPEKLPFLIDCVEAEGIGIPLCPPMDPLLAQSLVGSLSTDHRHAGPGGRCPFNLAVGRKPPGFAVPQDDKQSSRVRNAYRASALAARDLNAMQLLLSSLRLIVTELGDAPGEYAAEIDKTLRMMADINVHAIEWLGHGMDYCMQAERSRWLHRVRLVGATDGETERRMMELPAHPTSLMGGGLDLLRREVEARKSTKDLLEATTDFVEPQTSVRPRQSRRSVPGHADRARSTSSRGRIRTPRTPSSSIPRSERGAAAARSTSRHPPRDGKTAGSHKARGKPRRK